MPAEYEVRRHKLTGKVSVTYPCPHCREELHSPLSDAGKPDTCPACKLALTVPGVAERNAAEAEAEAAKVKQVREAEEIAERRREWEKSVQATAARAASQLGSFEPTPYQVMVWLGAAFILVGVVVTLGFANYDAATDSGVLNIGLLDDRMIGVAVGLTLFLAGVLLVGLATVGKMVTDAVEARKP